MTYANRVNLQGYLEIVKAESVPLDGEEVPVLHGRLHSGKFLSSHKLLITNYPAAITLELMREFKDTGVGQMMIKLDGQEVEVSILRGMPLVAVDGRLLSRPGEESVIEVKWITFLSVPPLIQRVQDERLLEIVEFWESIRERDRRYIYQYLRDLVGERGRRLLLD